LEIVKKKAQEFDVKGLRWVVVDSENQRVPLYCAIHRTIFEDILRVSLPEEPPDVPKS